MLKLSDFFNLFVVIMFQSVNTIAVYYLGEAPVDHVGEHEHEAVYNNDKPEFDVWKDVRNVAIKRFCF